MKRSASRRTDAEYWQRLRRDRRSNAAVILAAVAALFGTLGVITALVDGPHHAPSAGFLSWLLMLPMAWWVGDLARFTARAVRLWTSALLLSVGGAGLGLAFALLRGDALLVPLLSFGLAVPAALASLALRRASLVEREGPAR
ncbi:hypothetical protein [Aureimonas pseudogalii]|uniref:Uncharacterized protein n=1 Tax=Aureimonas pseudogalii TaxID=1744844 RepID=A0A7W6H7V8_9HYPH|nr:hypothetical protein [Aureimonas pseudogalii]MBB4000206.1 hypothetical protein [Aureimonas pseudogalii]